jgi:hypothetical protein
MSPYVRTIISVRPAAAACRPFKHPDRLDIAGPHAGDAIGIGMVPSRHLYFSLHICST